MSGTTHRMSLLLHPYREILPIEGRRPELRDAARRPGSALVWSVGAGRRAIAPPSVQNRPGGLALIALLPPAGDLASDPDLIHLVHRCRPQGILPDHLAPDPGDLAQVLRRPPSDLAGEVTDYLAWRGLGVDRDTTQLLRRIIELSGELRTITALARGLYLSRRALGRRLMTRGLPVPSHWLQLGRMLRLSIRLQNSDESVFSIAYDSGYPDGFSVSNQMNRLMGFRPSQVREYLGWEWLLEAWLRREAESGGLAPPVARAVNDGVRAGESVEAPRARPGRPRRKTKRPTV